MTCDEIKFVIGLFNLIVFFLNKPELNWSSSAARASDFGQIVDFSCGGTTLVYIVNESHFKTLSVCCL